MLVRLEALYILPLEPLQALLLSSFWMSQLPPEKLAHLRIKSEGLAQITVICKVKKILVFLIYNTATCLILQPIRYRKG